MSVTDAEIQKNYAQKGPYPLFSMKDYELRGYYRCSKTETFKEVKIEAKRRLDSSSKDRTVGVNIQNLVSCPKATTPVAPGMPR